LQRAPEQQEPLEAEDNSPLLYDHDIPDERPTRGRRGLKRRNSREQLFERGNDGSTAATGGGGGGGGGAGRNNHKRDAGTMHRIDFGQALLFTDHQNVMEEATRNDRIYNPADDIEESVVFINENERLNDHLEGDVVRPTTSAGNKLRK
jgi:hypothetical protein